MAIEALCGTYCSFTLRVAAIAEFLTRTAEGGGHSEPVLISLNISSRDRHGVSARRPGTWLGRFLGRGVWRGKLFQRVRSKWAEFEFARFRHTRELRGLGKPVAVQCATRAKIERRRRNARPQGLAGWWRKAVTVITDHMDDRALRAVDAIQVENTWMLEYARRINVGREVDLRYAPPGIDVNVFCALSERNLTHDPYILCVGRLKDPRKNISLLLDAYALIPEGIRSRVRMVLAGIQPDELQ